MTKRIQSYEILSTVGSGGMGVVYQARHILQNKLYAIKALYPQFCSDPVTRKRFENEALILSKLSDPNILKVYDFFEFEGGLYIVMEYIDGKPLSRIIGKETGPIPFTKALPLFMQILSGVEHAHAQGVIHRDLKPGNILITPDGTAKITDFGIAKIETGNKLTGTGTHIGTLYYMSPEQIRGEAATQQSDIYSLGITLYEMLAGKTPFLSSPDIPEFRVMEQIVYQPLQDPRNFYPYIPEPLVAIIMHAAQKNPQDRIRSASEFHQLLKTFLATPGTGTNETPVKEFPPSPVSQPGTEPAKVQPSPTQTTSHHPGPGTTIERRRRKKRISTVWLSVGLILFFTAIYLINKYDLLVRKGPPVVPGDTVGVFVQKEDMAWVEAGQFMMGSNFFDDEQPIHQVQLDTFFVDRNEVTVAQYHSFCEATGRKMPRAPSWGWKQEHPIVNVSWEDANDYAKWAGKRLPTEAEWEYAARGGRRSGGGKYSGSNTIGDVAWYADNSDFTTHPVRTKKANELGIYDMSGNVWEWCEDGYSEHYSEVQSPAVNPVDKTAGRKVVRGGAWFYDETSARVANRRGESARYKSPMIGFRCAVSRQKQ